MSIDTDLRTTIPDDLEALDHEDLQRRGRNRRIGTRVAGGLGALAIAAGALGVVTSLTAPAPSLSPIGPGGTTADQDPDAEQQQELAEEAARLQAEEARLEAEAATRAAIDEATSEAKSRDRAVPDAQVVADFAALPLGEALDVLGDRSTTTPSPTSEEQLTASSAAVEVGEHPGTWSQVDRSQLTPGPDGPTNDLLRAELAEGTTTRQLRALLPSLLPPDAAVGDEGPAWFVGDPHAGETPPGTWLADEVVQQLAALGTPLRLQPPETMTSDDHRPSDAEVRANHVRSAVHATARSQRVMTDLLDRTVVAFRVEFDQDGVTETLDVQFDPVTGRLTGAEAVIHTGTDAAGAPLVQTEASVIR